jgi:hypothetical protein
MDERFGGLERGSIASGVGMAGASLGTRFDARPRRGTCRETRCHAEITPKEFLDLVQTKSPTELSEDLLAVVQGQTDPAMFQEWFNRALKTSSLEEVRSIIGLS